VKVQHDNGNGKIKKVTERYLVDAMSVTEAEARVTEVMKEDLGSNDFEVVSASVSRIYKVIG
jgi:hypothetical protein